MQDNFEKEIPKGRINMVIDYEKNGARKRKELPFKLLILSDLQQNQGPVNLSKIQRISINKSNFDNVMRQIKPQVDYTVPNTILNHPTLNINLQFEKFKHFHPEQIALHIPELRKLLGMRNLLKDLKVNFLNNNALRRELEKIIKFKEEFIQLKNTLNDLPLSSQQEEEVK